MPRISLNPPRTLINRITAAYSRRTYGKELEPALAFGHSPRALLSYVRFEKSIEKLHALDRTLKDLAVMAAAHRVGCSWCTDFGYWSSYAAGVDEVKLQDVPRWRDSDRFSQTERLVLEYAEAMSGEVTEVTDEMVDALVERLGNAAIVELTLMIAVENQRARFNSALGLTSQGFKAACGIKV